MGRRNDSENGGGGGGSRRRQNRHGLVQGQHIDYKDVYLLRNFVGERGKLLSRRISGVSARNQREITRSIRRARRMALLPYGTD